MDSERRQGQITELVAHLAGEFFARESNRESLMTVTRAVSSPDLNYMTIFFTVLPEKFEQSALDFAKRQRGPFRDYLKKHSRFHPLPTIDFEIDYGEKNRQHIDELTRE